MSMIYLNFEMFDGQQNVYMLDDQGAKELAVVPYDELGMTIAALCDENQIYTVRLDGQTEYTKEIMDDVKVSNFFTYGNKNEIEFILGDE